MKMKASAVLLSTILVLIACVQCDEDCLYPCNYHLDALCAEDGNEFRYFGNDCFMNRHNHCYGKGKLTGKYLS